MVEDVRKLLAFFGASGAADCAVCGADPDKWPCHGCGVGAVVLGPWKAFGVDGGAYGHVPVGFERCEVHSGLRAMAVVKDLGPNDLWVGQAWLPKLWTAHPHDGARTDPGTVMAALDRRAADAGFVVTNRTVEPADVEKVFDDAACKMVAAAWLVRTGSGSRTDSPGQLKRRSA